MLRRGIGMNEQAEIIGADQDARSAAVIAGVAHRPRLLVIDDDNLHRMIICRVAAKAGYLPAGAATYEEAAQLAQDNTFDCITLDLSLGEHAGVELLRHLWVVGCKATVIIISGCDDATCGDSRRVAESLKFKVWESIPKPVNLAVLRDSLERLKADRERGFHVSAA
jgi:two-component system, chemotaxis family, chemotaxis protein CheY